MNDFDAEKITKELIKKTLENDNRIPSEAKEGLKIIIEMEHDPEKLLIECLLYMMSYK